METLLKLIFVIILIYYAMRLFLRYVLPWLLARFVAKQQEKFNNMNGFQDNFNSRQEGDLNIKTNKSNNKSDDSGFGEYVDFEEVDD